MWTQGKPEEGLYVFWGKPNCGRLTTFQSLFRPALAFIEFQTGIHIFPTFLALQRIQNYSIWHCIELGMSSGSWPIHLQNMQVSWIRQVWRTCRRVVLQCLTCGAHAPPPEVMCFAIVSVTFRLLNSGGTWHVASRAAAPWQRMQRPIGEPEVPP